MTHMRNPLVLVLALATVTVLHGQNPDAQGPRVLFMIGEREYDTTRTLPAWARAELAPLGMRLEFVHASAEEPDDFPGLEALAGADLLVLSVRRRALRAEQMQILRTYLEGGGPLVALRTSSHAFHLRGEDPPEGRTLWESFDREVLGGHYQGHHGAGAAVTLRAAPGAEDHPLLEGVKPAAWRGHGSLYKSGTLGPAATALLLGSTGEMTKETVAWIHHHRGTRVFYTSLGHAEDFQEPGFRRLMTNAVRWALEFPPDAATPSPETSRSQFKVAEDLEVDLVLAEPDIAQPLHLSFDARGRLWVVEYRQYPYPAGLMPSCGPGLMPSCGPG